MNRFVVKSHFDLPCVEITGVRLVLGKKRKGSTDFKAHKGSSVEPLGSRLGLFYLSKVIDLKFFFRLDFEPVLQVCLFQQRFTMLLSRFVVAVIPLFAWRVVRIVKLNKMENITCKLN